MNFIVFVRSINFAICWLRPSIYWQVAFQGPRPGTNVYSEESVCRSKTAMMEIESGLEILVFFNKLTWLLIRKYLIAYCHLENLPEIVPNSSRVKKKTQLLPPAKHFFPSHITPYPANVENMVSS